MLRHLVMWKLKDFAEGNTKSENARLIKERLEALGSFFPGIRDMEVGVNQETSEYANFDAVLDISFDNYDEMVKYQTHPEHQKLAEWIGKVKEARSSVDYISEK
ncbi:MAG TPA: stress responsive protein [Bacteroidales bacterium]|nr:MAG: stress responsive protein [Bacteroidetes bacterium GWE2_42_24]OFY26366.1 MAG: stress responsive protein [Bacteroidetes bacterium GWF2_43_11]PKP27895.1 MAG: stress responsive protein [Bacteroidetes bacterium HGW-Bacteroidetes-22]HAQ65571.1 stress responsive protein [Bacteroidales bacterium]HBZ66874.1 stress responsive protein [Bacteroidales bacterium]